MSHALPPASAAQSARGLIHSHSRRHFHRRSHWLFNAFAALALACAAHAPAPAWAKTWEVKMLNRNATGPMPFEPDYLHIAPGDKVKFLAVHNGHNAASIPGMAPEGAPSFTGKINEEIEVAFEQPGLYGVRCMPHYTMGMVMLIRVGDGPGPQQMQIPPEVPAAAQKRFHEIAARAQQAGE